MATEVNNSPFVGTELKLNVNIAPLGEVTMDDYDFEIEAFCSVNKTILIKKNDAIRVDENNYIILIDTSLVGAGDLKLKIKAFIPDGDFDDGLRTEVLGIRTGIPIIKNM